jgi:hypothetical protein
MEVLRAKISYSRWRETSEQLPGLPISLEQIQSNVYYYDGVNRVLVKGRLARRGGLYRRH